MATPEGTHSVSLFDDQQQAGRNAKRRVELPALGNTLSQPAEQRVDPVTGEQLILRLRRDYDKGDNL